MIVLLFVLLVQLLLRFGYHVPLLEYMYRRRFRETMLSSADGVKSFDFKDAHGCFCDRTCWAPSELERHQETSGNETKMELKMLPIFRRRAEEKERVRKGRTDELVQRRLENRKKNKLEAVLAHGRKVGLINAQGFFSLYGRKV